MHRWIRNDLYGRERPTRAPAVAQPRGLLIACDARCFEPASLAASLLPDFWHVLRTEGNILPPFGAGYRQEEEQIEQAIAAGVERIAVCGHSSCAVITRLLEIDAPAPDLVLREWLRHAEAVRRIADPGDTDWQRHAVEFNVQLQLAHVQTHPAVAAARAAGRLQLLAWVHDDDAREIFCPPADGGSFARRAALLPDHNLGLRPAACRHRAPPRPTIDAPDIYLA